MEALRGSDGIIDLVNSYVIVALSSGFVGLALFVGPFALVVLGILRCLFSLDKHSEEHLLGRALLGALVAILVTIATVSSICAVAVVYFTVMGMGAGYVRMITAAQRAGGRMGGMPVPVRPAMNPRMGQPQPRRQH
jgi:hypothetical protein